MTTDPADRPENGWESWWEGLRAAVTEFDRQLTAGLPAPFPQLRPPTGTDRTGTDRTGVPPELVAPLAEVLADLDRLTERTQTLRDELAEELSSLPRPRRRPSSGYSYDLGSTLDVAG